MTRRTETGAIEDFLISCDLPSAAAWLVGETLMKLPDADRATLGQLLQQGNTALFEKVRRDLDWRGPNGSEARYVVLPREVAAALVGYSGKV